MVEMDAERRTKAMSAASELRRSRRKRALAVLVAEWRRASLTALLALATSAVGLAWLVPAVSSASFGLKKGGVRVTVKGEGNTGFSQAGGHPDSVTAEFNLKTVPNPVSGEEHGLPISDESPLRNATVEVPAGLTGDPTALPRCTLAQLAADGTTLTECPDSSQVGVAVTEFNLNGLHAPITSAVYNMVPVPGQPALFAFKVVFAIVVLVPSLRSNGDYGFNITATNISQSVPVTTSKVTFWGVPQSPVHDSERGNFLAKVCADGSPGPPCTSDAPLDPFLRLPTDCNAGLSFGFDVESWSGKSDFQSVFAQDPEGHAVGVTRCDRVPFEPSIGGGATTDSAGTASGLDFSMSIPETGIKNPDGYGQGDLKKAVVRLPEGVTLNPSAGEGLVGCTPAEYASEQAKTPPGAGCPNASKLGTVTIDSPLLNKAETVTGSVFLAEPDDPATSTPGAENPFDSLLAIYMVARLPERGVIIKAAGRIDNDPVTGQITTTFENLPELPFSHFRFHLREGARAPLVSAPTCGPEITSARLTPWSASNPEEVTEPESTVLIDHGVGGGACPAGGVPPFDPGLFGGTLNNAAAQYSPFYMRILRKDGEQELTRFSTIMPPGLSGNLNGIPFCPEAAIEAARVRTGKQELAEPSCPAASEIGHTLVGAGVGGVLAYTPGKIYLAGPYHGASLSIVSVTSATVGPFDLGTVVIRFALRINPVTAQVEVDATGSDPIPHIIKGIVVHVRDIRVYIDRSEFMLNPSDCAPMAFSAIVSGSGANFASTADDVPHFVADRFQAADCASLAFKPVFKASASGKTSRADGARLHVSLTYPKEALGKYANIKAVKVDLPKQLPSRLPTLQKACLDTVFEANPAACPAESRVGMAKAMTPILPVPLEGPAYFVSHGGVKFPELIIVLQGYGVTIDLHGETFISKSGVTSSTFRTIPDQPVTSFELTLPEGPYSALAAPGGLCNVTKTVLVKKKVKVRSKGGDTKVVTRRVRQAVPAALQMSTAFTAQNGVVVKQNTPIEVTGCARHKVKKKRKANRHGKQEKK